MLGNNITYPTVGKFILHIFPIDIRAAVFATLGKSTFLLVTAVAIAAHALAQAPQVGLVGLEPWPHFLVVRDLAISRVG